ncbi:MAG TPA: DNA polymerase III subunit gamma/tau [Verrucomicrobiae bacterium]|jgi:DNA polymerase-3 subunit gamma/tau|nr:DNA polymerase III subunit gamma/tau [Verrucomicrobiae bacterium]
MSYQVIARKYRPQRFADVVGQEHVTQTLSNAIEQNRIAHAYLFCGPRGTGKTTIARIFAKCLRCKNAPTTDPCNECPDCLAITSGNSIEMLEFDAASNTQVEKIREMIIDHVKYMPASGKYKLYLVDEVHMLSTSSFNALLKTLEEPPPHVIFLFATTDPEKLPPTILSRCQRFDLRRIPAALITKHLTQIAKTEKVKIDPAALNAIARGADGGMRDAESTLDQLISFCGDKIEETDVLSMFGLAAESQILNLSGAVLNGEIQTALTELGQLAQGGKDLGRLLSDLLNHFRNLLIYKISNGDLNLVEVSESEAASLKEQSALANSDALMRILDTFAEAELNVRDAASKRIFLEVALLKAIEARNAIPIDSVLKQLNQLRGQGGGGPAQAAPPVSVAPSTAAPRPVPKSPAPPKQGVEQLRDAAPPAPAVTQAPAPISASSELSALWANLVETVGRASPFVKSYLLEAHPVSFEKNLLIIGFDPEFSDHLGLVDNSRNHAVLQTKLAELGHPHSQVKFIEHEGAPAALPVSKPAPQNEAAPEKVTAQPAAAAPTREGKEKTPVAFNKNDFKNDPLIQKALEIFKGQIVEVRA